MIFQRQQYLDKLIVGRSNSLVKIIISKDRDSKFKSNYLSYEKLKKVHFYVHVCLCVFSSFVILLSMSSCSAFKDVFRDDVVESISDPKTGTPIFTREYDTEPYGINVGEIIKSSKVQKKNKKKEFIENYELKQNQ